MTYDDYVYQSALLYKKYVGVGKVSLIETSVGVTNTIVAIHRGIGKERYYMFGKDMENHNANEWLKMINYLEDEE